LAANYANEEGNFMCAEQRESATRATVEAHESERRGQPARRLQSATAAEGKKMTDVLIEFIKQYVEKHPAHPPKK